MERGSNMFHPGVEHWLGRERVVEMRKEVE